MRIRNEDKDKNDRDDRLIVEKIKKNKKLNIVKNDRSVLPPSWIKKKKKKLQLKHYIYKVDNLISVHDSKLFNTNSIIKQNK